MFYIPNCERTQESLPHFIERIQSVRLAFEKIAITSFPFRVSRFQTCIRDWAYRTLFFLFGDTKMSKWIVCCHCMARRLFVPLETVFLSLVLFVFLSRLKCFYALSKWQHARCTLSTTLLFTSPIHSYLIAVLQNFHKEDKEDLLMQTN